MSYSKTTWKTGDTITAQLLNHAEDGIAANDAAIAAIPAGVQLYGPYYANGSASAAAGQQKIISCSTLEDANGISVTPPATDAKLLLTFLNSGIGGEAKGLFVSVKLPTYEEGWIPANVQIVNLEEEAKTFEPRIGFYSTVEFPQES